MADVRLIHGDCLSVLPGLESGSVDCVITDPPYGTKTNQRDSWMVGEFSNVMPLVLPLLHQVLKNDGGFYCFTSWSMMAEWLLRYQQYFKLQNILVWDKKRHSGCFSPHSWQFTWEGIFFGIKGPRKIRKYLPDVLHSEERGKRLPMQKPVDVICKLIEASTDPGDTVLDPFLGSGSVAIACMNTGRNFIGVEISKEYHAIAEKRIAAAQQDQREKLSS